MAAARSVLRGAGLYTQLLTLASGLLALALAGLLYIHVSSTRSLLTEQLERHAQDTATALGLTLSRELASKDALFLESIVDAAFDPGYFRSINVDLRRPQVKIDRQREVQVDGVPAWFVRGLELPTPIVSARVMGGWQQAGEVTVVAHPGFAYGRLWDATVSAFGWSLLTLCLAVLAAAVLQRWLLEPLTRLEAHAQAVMRGEFPELSVGARTHEMARVLTVVSRMTTRLADAAREHYQRVCELRETAYLDPTTGVGNQRAFTRHLASVLSDGEHFQDGVLLLVQVDGLEALNQSEGMGAGDAWLNTTAHELNKLVVDTVTAANQAGLPVPLEATHICRLAGATFGVVLSPANEASARAIIDGLLARHGEMTLSAGATLFSAGQAAHLVRARAEQALALQPESEASFSAALTGVAGKSLLLIPNMPAADVDERPDTAANESWWLDHLPKVIESGAIELVAQPVVTVQSRRLMHREVLVRVRDAAGEAVPAGVFLPLAGKLGLMPDFDRAVLEALLARIEARGQEQRYALNLSLESVRADGFMSWLTERLGPSGYADRVIFEINMNSARHLHDEVLAAAATLRTSGAAVGLDHVGVDDLDLDWLTRVGAAYLKLDGGFADHLWSDPTQQDYVRSLVTLAHSLDARLIAEHIADPASMQVLQRLRVDGVQGYAIAPPQAFD